MNEITVNLDSIPAGNYTQIKIGLGVSPDAYLLGLDHQGQFWAQASNAGMTWSWAAGYVFTILEGKYGTESPTENFSSHSGNMGDVLANGTPNLYREVQLSFPVTIEVQMISKMKLYLPKPLAVLETMKVERSF